MKIPGVVWTALLVGLPLLAAWLEQFFPGAIWAAPVGGLLLIAVKVIEVVRSAPADTLETMQMEARPVAEPSKTSRILWG